MGKFSTSIFFKNIIAPLAIGLFVGYLIIRFWFSPTLTGFLNSDYLEIQRAGSALIAMSVIVFALTRGIERNLRNGLDELRSEETVRFLTESISSLSIAVDHGDNDAGNLLIRAKALRQRLDPLQSKVIATLALLQVLEVAGIAWGTIQNGFADILLCYYVGSAC